jgi:hypothetical protein
MMAIYYRQSYVKTSEKPKKTLKSFFGSLHGKSMIVVINHLPLGRHGQAAQTSVNHGHGLMGLFVALASNVVEGKTLVAEEPEVMQKGIFLVCLKQMKKMLHVVFCLFTDALGLVSQSHEERLQLLGQWVHQRSLYMFS